MTNAIKFILAKRKMKQVDLLSDSISKQDISKWILKQRRIPTDKIKYLEDKLQVPRDYFIDNDRYCKTLAPNEMFDLEAFLTTGKDKFKVYLQSVEDELEYNASREYSIDINIRKLQRNIRNNIYKTNGDEYSISSKLDTIESNIDFFQKVLFVREKRFLHDSNEWNALYKAICFLGDATAGESVDNDNELVQDIYAAFKRHRARKAQLAALIDEIHGTQKSEEN